MKNNISDIFFNTVSISALRGGLFLSIFLISQQSSLAQFGQISAIYVFVVSGAQIIGYCLSTVALDLSVESQHKKNNISLISVFWWMLFCIIIATPLLLGISFFKAFIFNNIISSFTYVVGVIWLCGMALELLSVGIGIGQGRILLMATASLVQLIIMISGVFFATKTWGADGIAVLAASSFVFGSIVILWTSDFRDVRYAAIQWRTEFRSKMKVVVGPSVCAALFLTALNMALVSIVAYEDGALRQLSLFAIAMQVLSISSFLPQVIANFAITRTYQALARRDPYIRILVNGAGISVLACLILSGFIWLGASKIANAYGPAYVNASTAIAIIAIVLIAQAPLQILTQRYVIIQRQWRLAAISLFSTLGGIASLLAAEVKSADSMVIALLVANTLRFALTVADLLAARRLHPTPI